MISRSRRLSAVTTNKLVIEKLGKKYRHRTVLQEVSLSVNTGEIVGLLGPNGAGKTTCFYSIVGLVKPDRGLIYLDNREITKLPVHKRARLGIAYLPQEKSVFSDLTVSENVQAILEITHQSTGENNRKHALDLLRVMGVNHLADSPAHELSGGERRRVEIARLLAMRPNFILMDEPFAAISPIAVKELQDIILRLKKKNIGIIITDHSVRETLKICDRVYILEQGRVLVEGSAKEIIANQAARDRYLGSHFDAI
jgi:lipopolysaccharide export system ATP-binding protein